VAANMVESNTLSTTTTAAVTTIIPLSDIVSESIATSCCVDDNDNWNHYQAISNYCFEKLSTINNDSDSVEVCTTNDSIDTMNNFAVGRERIESSETSTTTLKVDNDMVIQMKWGPSHKIVRPIVFPFAA
jgi:hypothetical protein